MCPQLFVRSFVILSVLFSALLSKTPVSAADLAFITGNDLTDTCRAFMRITRNGRRLTDLTDSYNAGICLGAVQGANDAMVSLGKTGYCLPVGTTGDALAEVVANFLEANPQQRSEKAISLIHIAFLVAWPCKQ
jgi:hypothetical protein